MPGTVFAIRAHAPSVAVTRLHDALTTGLPDADIVVAVDQLGGIKRRGWSAEYDLVPINDPLLDSLGLRADINDAGWRCGDYAYYALAAAVDFEHAWLIEPDVGLANIDVSSFFGRFAVSSSDLIAADMAPAPDWRWSYQLTARGVEEPWRCFFPMTRMSRAAIDAALELRRGIQWIDAGDFGHPNDEGIVASAVAAAGLRWEDLRLGMPTHLAHFHHRPKLQSAVVAEVFGGPFVVHPALGHEEFVASLRRTLLHAVKHDLRTCFRQRVSAARTLEALGDYALLTNRQRRIHEAVLGRPDAVYDAHFRRRVLETLPRSVRLLVSASGLLVRGTEAVTPAAGKLGPGRRTQT